MEFEKEMTAPVVSVGADTEQSSQTLTDNSLTDFDPDFKGSDDDLYREIQRRMAPDYLETVSMTTLYDTDFEGQEPLIDGLLYRGAYLLAGSPKIGKSFLMAQLAYQVSTGLPLWGYKVRKTGVLYFALEDNYARLQRRLFRMFGAEAAENLYFATHCKTANSGLEDQIRSFMREHPHTGLIIIDTLKRVREVGGADFSYSSDYDIVSRLKTVADSYKVTMVIVHHTRKLEADDKFDMIAGTNGLLGAADGGFVSARKNAPPMRRYWMSPGEIRRISGCTLPRIPKHWYGSWKAWKRSFGRSRQIRFWKASQHFFLRRVNDGKALPLSCAAC